MVPRPPHNANTNTPPAEVSQWMRANAHRSWGMTEDREARTRNARAKFQAKFLEEANGDPVRAESLRKAFYVSLAAKSAAARRRNREARESGAA